MTTCDICKEEIKTRYVMVEQRMACEQCFDKRVAFHEKMTGFQVHQFTKEDYVKLLSDNPIYQVRLF